jgi:aminopeptidase N
MEQLGFDARAGESDEIRLRRAELVTLVAVVAEAESAREQAEARCQSYLKDRLSLDANLVTPVLAVGAQNAGAARLSAYLEASTSDPTPQERRRFRMALGDVRDAKLVDSVLRLCLTDRIPTQDVALLLARLLSNRHARVATWGFIKAEWPSLRERMPAMLVSRLVEVTPRLRGETYRKEVASFFAANPVPSAARALRQAQERFRLDAAFRKRAAPALRRWLSELR